MQNTATKINVKITRIENAEFFQCEINDIIEVELEKYVAAVVASEIGNAHIEACKAQAIAARSFAIARGVLDGKPISDSSATAQAYRAARYNSKYANAIAGAEATAGLALTYNNQVISAVYTAANGG
jgi:stage II sporulation protein D